MVKAVLSQLAAVGLLQLQNAAKIKTHEHFISRPTRIDVTLLVLSQ